jgi:hypothetical protein
MAKLLQLLKALRTQAIGAAEQISFDALGPIKPVQSGALAAALVLNQRPADDRKLLSYCDNADGLRSLISKLEKTAATGENESKSNFWPETISRLLSKSDLGEPLLRMLVEEVARQKAPETYVGAFLMLVTGIIYLTEQTP